MSRAGRLVGMLAVALVAASGAVAGASSLAEDGVADPALQPATRAPPPRRPTLVAGGDIVPEIPVLDAGAAAAAPGARFAFGPMFAPVRAVVEAADLAICHLETPVGPPGAEFGLRGRTAGGAGLLLAPHELAVGVRDAGFDRCSTASNHSNDFGAAGITQTLDALDELGLGLAICNEMTNRTVYPAVRALADPVIDPALRSQLADCLARTRSVVPDAG